jgi:hypothetical protein
MKYLFISGEYITILKDQKINNITRIYFCIDLNASQTYLN